MIFVFLILYNNNNNNNNNNNKKVHKLLLLLFLLPIYIFCNNVDNKLQQHYWLQTYVLMFPFLSSMQFLK